MARADVRGFANHSIYLHLIATDVSESLVVLGLLVFASDVECSISGCVFLLIMIRLFCIDSIFTDQFPARDKKHREMERQKYRSTTLLAPSLTQDWLSSHNVSVASSHTFSCSVLIFHHITDWATACTLCLVFLVAVPLSPSLSTLRSHFLRAWWC